MDPELCKPHIFRVGEWIQGEGSESGDSRERRRWREKPDCETFSPVEAADGLLLVRQGGSNLVFSLTYKHQDFNGEGQGALLAHYSSQEYRLELERNYIEVGMVRCLLSYS